MNDQQTYAGYVGYDAHPMGSSPTGGYSTGTFAADPLFGDLPGSYEAEHSGQYDTTQWDTGAHRTAGYDAAHVAQPGGQTPEATYGTTGQWTIPAAQDGSPFQPEAGTYDVPGGAPGYDASGQWDANTWNTSGQFATVTDAAGQWPAQGHTTESGYETGTHDTGAYPTGTYATEAYATGTYATGTGGYGATGYDTTYGTGTYEVTGSYDAATWNPDGAPEAAPTSVAGPDPASASAPAQEQVGYGTSQFAAVDLEDLTDFTASGDPVPRHDHATDIGHAESSPEPTLSPTADPRTDPTTDPRTDPGTGFENGPAEQLDRSPAYEPAAGRRPSGARGRRRTPAKRSALLTVAVPSVCVMGVAGVAAATVGGLSDSGDATTTQAAADPSSVKPVAANNKLDTQLANLSHEADDFADRASRTQERIDLKQRQADAKKKAAADAARKEAARPKFLLPVKQKGLSAYFGQAGVNWMSVHTGIDFPVSYGTPVMAATDGTVRTQWNNAYGNMAIVTAPDGTETWYCHLSSTKIRSGSVKAGDVIAYSGNSGNSTGPHMHFEVHPQGGAAVDPLPWLRSHGLDPT